MHSHLRRQMRRMGLKNGKVTLSQSAGDSQARIEPGLRSGGFNSQSAKTAGTSRLSDASAFGQVIMAGDQAPALLGSINEMKQVEIAR